VPRQKIASIVDGKGLADVRCDKIVVSVLTPRAERLGKLGWKLRQALDGIDVIPLLGR
jgi:hypothetical protein